MILKRKCSKLLIASMLVLTFIPQNSSAMLVFDSKNFEENLASKLHLIEMYKMELKKIEDIIESIKNGTKIFDIFSKGSQEMGTDIPTRGTDKIGQYK